ncbi:TetR/AcrR family transcriptional regulator [Plantactinospora sp. S1510]|uniref:TetR/AcrR family transcriptional regulator n=1 Tax=Plantactinospora alkalitolerans TaxID=2789879 RepID=A0ABS0H7P1_9ACTN|nr:TetR/AcrR family transcriptional regulator [Plantactinospora alkalitolerans]MBF9134493.1 TetR/AcrR family transcriptional regulator [Plantactinospora alkalitolerans]
MGKGELTKQTVLATATEIAGRLGLAGLTIGSLASQVEMSKSGLFGHFRSKEALQMEVLAYARESFVETVIHPALAAPRGERRVRTLVERWLACSLGREPGCLMVSAAAEFDDQPGPVRDQLVRDHRDLMDSVAQMFRTGISEGEFRPDADPEQFAHDLYGVMLGFFHAHRLMKDPAATSRSRRAVDALLDNARI